MVEFKFTRGDTRRISNWSTDDLEDPVNQINILHTALDQKMRSGQFKSVSEAAGHIYSSVFGAMRLAKEVQDAPRVKLQGLFFRALPYESDLPPEDFGPLPRQPRNRFNSETERALYIARTDRILVGELAQTNPVKVLWAQKFEVPSSHFLVLMLDPDSVKDFPCLNHLMLLSERPRSEEPLDPYVATQFLRVLCDAHGIDAVAYPTVTGSYPMDSQAINVAVFSEAAIQIVLAGRKDAPYCISTPA